MMKVQTKYKIDDDKASNLKRTLVSDLVSYGVFYCSLTTLHLQAVRFVYVSLKFTKISVDMKSL